MVSGASKHSSAMALKMKQSAVFGFIGIQPDSRFFSPGSFCR